MASLIESVRKLHGPHLVTHENGFDVDVICQECTRLRLEALDAQTHGGEDWGYSEEAARVPYPCPTRITAGTSETEGRDEAGRLRLDRLVVQRDEIEEQMERLDAVIALIRRDLGEDETSEEPAETDVEQEDDPAPDTAAPKPTAPDDEPAAESTDSANDDFDF